MSPPKWDGQVKKFCSWKCRFGKYLRSAGITKDEDQLMYILHTSVLPPRVTATIESCTTMRGHNGVWERLQEKIPKAAVIREIIAEMEAIRPIRQKTASEMRAVLDRLTDFARRITEVGKEYELQSATVIHIISRKLDPDLYYEFERWMRHDFPSEELSVTRIIEFLRAETEARESILPTKVARLADDKCEKSSIHHISGAAFTDPCPLGCGVHHKYIDCAQFQEKHPSERRDHIMATGRCFSCFGRHKSHECQKQKHCTECGGRHHRMLSCVMNRRLISPNQSVTPLNPSTVFTPHSENENSTTQRQGFLGHVHGLHAPQQLSPTTYVEVRDANGAWHQVVAFFDSGSDTTLVKSSLAQRLGLVGTPEVFHYGVAGGSSMKENSARYTLYVRPIHVYHRSVYAIEAMEIVRLAYDVPAISDAIFDEYPYLQPARGCLPLAGAEIDLLVGYDYAYLTTSVRTISAPNSTGHHHPSASFTRLGWTLFGGMIPQRKSSTGKQSAVQHLQRISDDTKATFYWDVPGVNPTTDCVCTDTDMDDAKCLKRARTTEIDDVHQYVCHSGAIPAQRTRSKCTLVPQNVSLVRMTTTTAVHVIQDTGAFEPESTHSADDYRTTKISQPPTAEWDGPTNFTLFDKRLTQVTSPNAPIDNEQLYNCGCESPTRTSEKDVNATIDADDRYCHAATRVVTRRNNWWNRGQVCLGRFSDSPNVDSLNFCLEQMPALSHQAGVHATPTVWNVVCIQKEPVHASVSRCRRRCLAHRHCLARRCLGRRCPDSHSLALSCLALTCLARRVLACRCPLSCPLLSRPRYFDRRRRCLDRRRHCLARRHRCRARRRRCLDRRRRRCRNRRHRRLDRRSLDRRRRGLDRRRRCVDRRRRGLDRRRRCLDHRRLCCNCRRRCLDRRRRGLDRRRRGLDRRRRCLDRRRRGLDRRRRCLDRRLRCRTRRCLARAGRFLVRRCLFLARRCRSYCQMLRATRP